MAPTPGSSHRVDLMFRLEDAMLAGVEVERRLGYQGYGEYKYGV